MEEPKPKKKKSTEFIITMLLLSLISLGSAGYVIWFRIKMKPYQIKYDDKNPDQEMDFGNTDKNAPQNEVK